MRTARLTLASSAAILAMTLTASLAVGTSGPVGASILGSEPISVVLSGRGTAVGQLQNPTDLAVDDDGNLYILDSSNLRVQMVTSAGGISEVGTTAQIAPFGIALDSNDDLYVVDEISHQVQRVAADGTVSTIIGGEGSGANQLQDPTGIAFDSNDNLYIADWGNHRVQVVTPAGAVTTVAGLTGLNHPLRVAVDSNDNLFISDQYNHRVLKVDGSGTVTTVAGTGTRGSGTNQLSYPTGIALDSDDTLHIADRANHRIQQIQSDGSVVTVAGGVGPGSDLDELNFPYGLAFDADDNLYIADAYNHRVVMLDADNEAPTISITTSTSVTQGDPLTAQFSCIENGTSALASCTATVDGVAVANGETISTTTVGSVVLEVAAADTAGNAVAESITIAIAAPVPTIATPTAGPRELTGQYAATTGTNGIVARLYMAVFTRQPDGAGFDYWVDEVDSGNRTALDVARFFITSPEFQTTYSDLDNTEFINLLYVNVMNRTGDAGGVAYWLGRLNAGEERAAVLLLFADSTEFKVLTGTS